MHFTPTYSSWLNQVERWFALVTDKRLRRGTHTSVEALEKDIRSWINAWNENPNPSHGPKPPTRPSNDSPHIYSGFLAQDIRYPASTTGLNSAGGRCVGCRRSST